MTYRNDIDGLRGISIILVLLFHFEINGMNNGFLGVDIFFVISGFLITQIILRDLKRGEFSFRNFYCRRIRRLFPALLTMLTIVGFLCFIFFDRLSFQKFGHSLVWTSLFSSNFWFWTETGYFAPSAIEKPLLHTWSLSVEEQFYLIFPLYIFFLNKFKLSTKLQVTVILFLISISLFYYGYFFHPDATFFLLPTRMWQLLAGTLVALICAGYNFKSLSNQNLHLLGVFLLLLSFFPQSLLSSYMPPSITCSLATALLLFPIKESKVSKSLSFKPLVWVGLISYSLYLWHWPIWVFYKYLSFDNCDISMKFTLLSISLLVAWLSWKFIEQPIRNIPITKLNRKFHFLATGIFLSLLATFGLLIVQNKGFAFRFPLRDEIETQNFWDWHPYGKSTRFKNLELNNNFDAVDIIGSHSATPEYLLWGDSHAMAFIPGLEIAAKENNSSFYALTRSGNPPLLNYEKPGQELIEHSILNKKIFDFIKSNDEIHTVLLAANWKNYWQKYKISDDPLGIKTVNFFNYHLTATIDALIQLEKDIVIFSQVPPLATKNFSIRYYSLITHFPFLYDSSEFQIPTSYKNYESKFSNFHKFLSSFQNENVRFLDLTDQFKTNKSPMLLFENNGIPLYLDSSHLSTYGSSYLSNSFMELFKIKRP